MSKTGYPDLTLENLAKTAGAFAAGGGAFVAGGFLEDKVRKRVARIKRFEEVKKFRRANNAVYKSRKTMGSIAERHFQPDKTTRDADIYNRFISQEGRPSKDQIKYDEARYRQQDPGPKAANDPSGRPSKKHDHHSVSQRTVMRSKMQSLLSTGIEEDERIFKQNLNPTKPANQNKPRRMGGGRGGMINPTGLVGKAVEKFFKKV